MAAVDVSRVFLARTDKLKSKLDQLESVFDIVFDSAFLTTKDLIEESDVNNAATAAQVKELHGGVMLTAAYRERALKSVSALNQIRTSIQRNPQLLDGDFDPVAQYERLYTESVQELVKEKMDNHEKVKEHEEQCWDVLHPGVPRPGQGCEDEEIMFNEGKQTFKCPITQQPYEHPVTNTECHHNYSKAAIEQHIRASRGHAKCPVAGCRNKNVQLQHLKPNKNLEIQVRRFFKEQRYTQQTQAENSDIVDVSD